MLSETHQHNHRPVPLPQSMLTEFNKENEAFINSKKSPSELVAPWVGYADEETLKEQILALSTVSRLPILNMEACHVCFFSIL